jgi:hypothetical protein
MQTNESQKSAEGPDWLWNPDWLKFWLSGNVGRDHQNIRTTPALAGVVSAYRENIERLISISEMPLMIAKAATVSQHFSAKASLELFKSLEVPADRQKEWSGRVAEMANAMSAVERSHFHEHARMMTENFFQGSDDLKRSAESILSGIAVGAWTAFETLAGDLWRDVINSHPHGLSDLKGRTKKRQRQNTPLPTTPVLEPLKNRTTDDEDEKTIPIALLQKYNYNLHGSMGTLLRKRFNFTALSGIRRAYYLAFHEDNADVDAAIDDKSLDALAAVRNLIVHRASRCDEEYQQKADRLPNIPQLSLGDKMQLDGEIVNRLLSGSIKSSVNLISSVDKWVQDHPEKTNDRDN